MLSRLRTFIDKCAFPLLVIIGAAVFGIHLTTVVDYPAAWFDEIEILEMGRFSFFDRFPQWSVNLFPGTDGTLHPPAPMFHYLAGLIQEGLYRLTGSFVPSRIFFLFSLPVAALLLCKWLLTKSIPQTAAFLTALFFLLDPNATICAHWYRPDLWTMCCAFGAMILLATTRGDTTWKRPTACLLAGILTATMLFLWITSMLLLPLIGWEALLSARPRSSDSCTSWTRSAIRDAISFTAGALSTTVLLLIPLYPHIPAIISQYAEHSELGGTAGLSDGLAKRIIDFIKIAIRSPFVWPAALLGLPLGKRHFLHILMFIGLCALMLATRVYHLRMVQLMPFLFLFTAIALTRALSLTGKFLHATRTLVIGGALTCYCGLSVLALNYAALPGENTFDAFTRKLQAALPMKSPRVYLYDMEHELYYSARALKWKMFSYTPRALILEPGKTAHLLDTLDAVIITSAAEQPTADELKALESHGFVKTVQILMPEPSGHALKRFFANLFYAHGYPSCKIFTRKRYPPTTRTTRTLRGQTRRTTRPQL